MAAPKTHRRSCEHPKAVQDLDVATDLLEAADLVVEVVEEAVGGAHRGPGARPLGRGDSKRMGGGSGRQGLTPRAILETGLGGMSTWRLLRVGSEGGGKEGKICKTLSEAFSTQRAPNAAVYFFGMAEIQPQRDISLIVKNTAAHKKGSQRSAIRSGNEKTLKN